MAGEADSVASWFQEAFGGGGGGGGGYATVQGDGVAATQRQVLDVVSGGGIAVAVTDDAGTRTKVAFTAPGGAVPATSGLQLQTIDTSGTAYWLPSGGFNVTSFAGAQNVLVNTVITNPPFTAAYNTPPDSAANSVVLTNTDGVQSPKDVTSTPTSFSITGTFQKTTRGASTTSTLTAKKGPTTITKQVLFNWWNHIIWGLLVSPTGTTAELDSLQTQTKLLTNVRDGNWAFGAGSGNPCIALPAGLGDPASWQIGPTVQTLDLVATVSWPNTQTTLVGGVHFTENYKLWKLSSTGLGAFTLQSIG